MSGNPSPIEVSIIVPLHNEVDNVEPLIHALSTVMKSGWEAVFVDDGSLDGTLGKLRTLAAQHPWCRIVVLSARSGQAAAMNAGFSRAKGRFLITMDGDLQNDPRDIPRVLAELEAGHDFVIGRRQDRKDRAITRKLPSLIANRLLTLSLGVPFRDIGCGLRGYRREVVERLWWFGEMHRYASILSFRLGFRTKEIPVTHHPRTAGVAKYGLGRIPRILRDLTLLLLITGRGRKMGRYFGPLGIVFSFGSLIYRGILEHGPPLWLEILFPTCAALSLVWFWFTGYCYSFYAKGFARAVMQPSVRIVDTVE